MTICTQSISDEMTDAELQVIAEELEDSRPDVILRWALGTFGPRVVLATGFGSEGCVLVSMIAAIDTGARIFYLDTDLLFPETYALRDQLATRYGVRFEQRRTSLKLEAQARLYGERLWERRPNECCHLRKIEPLKEVLSGQQAWITGIRREQSSSRALARVVERDTQFGLIKINPLAAWSTADLWHHIAEHEVPYNPLQDQGYESIGCIPCTTPVQIGEDPRAGRWRGTSKTECGIHQKRGMRDEG